MRSAPLYNRDVLSILWRIEGIDVQCFVVCLELRIAPSHIGLLALHLDPVNFLADYALPRRSNHIVLLLLITLHLIAIVLHLLSFLALLAIVVLSVLLLRLALVVLLVVLLLVPVLLEVLLLLLVVELFVLCFKIELLLILLLITVALHFDES